MILQAILVGLLILLATTVLLVVVYSSVKEFIASLMFYFRFRRNSEDLMSSFIWMSLCFMGLVFMALVIISPCD